MTRAAPFQRRALHWEVIAVLADDSCLVGANGLFQRCHHEHATQAEAEACPWTPEPWPEVCDLLVRQVRSERRTEQATMPWGPR
jgi:hypothetical protein